MDGSSVFNVLCFLFFFNDTATTEIYTLSLHDALPISPPARAPSRPAAWRCARLRGRPRSEEHTSELQSLAYLVCRLLLEKNKHTLLCDAELLLLCHAGIWAAPTLFH